MTPGTASLRNAAFALGILFAVPVAATPSLETFVLAVSGRANGTFDPPCTESAPPVPVSSFFGGWGVGVPTAGFAACGIVGGMDDLMSSSGPLPGNRSAASSWPVDNTSSSSADAVARYGSFSAHAHSEFAGFYSNLNATGSEGFGIASDDFTITSPSFANGLTGTVVFRTTVTGSMSTTSNCQFGVQLANRVNNSTYLLFRCNGNYAYESPAIYSWAGATLSGFTRSPGAMSGSDEITSAQIPIVFGTAFNYKLGLLVEAVSALTSVVDSNFEAAITHIDVKGPGGQTVTDFVITASSGTLYGPTGTSSVAELPAGPAVPGLITAFPNPARAHVDFRVVLPNSVTAELAIYDAAGRRIRELQHVPEHEGSRTTRWDGRDEQGVPVPSGVYFARLSWPGRSTITRFTLLR